jgi:hypothetical protein
MAAVAVTPRWAPTPAERAAVLESAGRRTYAVLWMFVAAAGPLIVGTLWP